MAFKKHTPRKIEIDDSTMTHESAEVAKRLERIESNYEQFDELMMAIEAKLPDEEKPKKVASKSESKNPKKPR